ncbi:MAG: TolC family protein, partial [Armatimonadota bacterium]
MKLLIRIATALIFAAQFGAMAPAGLAQAAGRPEPAALPPLNLERLIEIALEENPELKALRHRIDAAWNVVPQVGSLPDPMVGLQFSNVPMGTLAFDMTPMTGVQLVAQQAL